MRQTQRSPEGPRTDYMVVARRYRPQTFTDVIGQEHVETALTNAINSGRIGHAYLFTGARGVGKTSTARILAKALNCVNGPTTEPCGECESCRAIAAGDPDRGPLGLWPAQGKRRRREQPAPSQDPRLRRPGLVP